MRYFKTKALTIVAVDVIAVLGLIASACSSGDGDNGVGSTTTATVVGVSLPSQMLCHPRLTAQQRL